MCSSKQQGFPGFSSFFSLSDPSDPTAYHGRMGSELDPFALTRGDWRPEAPIVVERKLDGAELKDVVWTSLVVPLIVSHRVISLFEASRFTGWDTYPVAIQHDDPTVVHGYAGLCVVGRCGRIISERSGHIVKQMPGRMGKKVEYRVGWFFDESTWDGSDFFMAANYGAPFIHDRVKRCLEVPASRTSASSESTRLSGETADSLKPPCEHIHSAWFRASSRTRLVSGLFTSARRLACGLPAGRRASAACGGPGRRCRARA